MSKHIVIDARNIYTSTGRYTFNLVEQLGQLDTKFRFTVLVPDKKAASQITSNNNFTFIISPYKSFGINEQLGLLFQIIRLKPDLVHFCLPPQPLIYFGKTITTVHDLTPFRFPNKQKQGVVSSVKRTLYKRVVRYVVKKSSAIITDSKFCAKDITETLRVDPRKINTTYNGVSTRDTIASKTKHLVGDYLLYVGRVRPHKNLKKLVEAFNILQTKEPDLKLVLVGKADEEVSLLRQYVEKEKINNVIFYGYASDGELVTLYTNAKAYVFPSLSEGFGLPGLEAMAHGCPVVSSNATCLPEIYGDAAHYFNPEDVQDMATKILEVLSDKKLSLLLVKNGKKQLKKYSWRRTAEQTLAVYSKVLDSHS